ncbi:MAG TPA: PepSY domain-containing protein [Nitrososphaeraceae archaeon]
MSSKGVKWNTASKLTIAGVVAVGLVASAILVAFPMATAVSPLKGSQIANLTGSVNVKDAIKNFIKVNQNVTFSEASQSAQNQISNGTVVAGRLGIVEGYLVYTFLVVDGGNETMSKIIVDAGNGQVLHTSEPHTMKGFDFMHEKGKGGGHGNDHRMAGGGMWFHQRDLGENQTMYPGR